MSEPTPRTWSADDMIIAYERRGDIKSPFSADERALALSIAEAFAWAYYQKELPGGRFAYESETFLAWHWGIMKVCERRGDRRSTSPSTRP